MTKRPTEEWSVWELDAWGNEEDGFTVNNRHRVGKVMLPVEWTRSDVIRSIRRGGFLRSGRAGAVRVTDQDGTIEIDDSRNGEPLWSLERG